MATGDRGRCMQWLLEEGYLSSEVAQFSFAIRVSRAVQKAFSS